MSQPTLADVLLRLDRLEAALTKLVELTERGFSGAAPARPAPASAPAYAQAAAPVVPVAPPPAAAATAATAPTSPPAPTIAPDPRRTTEAPKVAVAPAGIRSDGRIDGRVEPPIVQVAPPAMRTSFEPPRGLTLTPNLYDPYADRTDIVVPPQDATIPQVLARVFEAGLMVEPEDTFALLTKLTHSSQMVGPRALDHYKAFAWNKLRRSASDYLRAGDPKAFSLAYTEPADITDDTEHVRVFVKAGGNRMPAPVGFARDPVRGGAWRVTMMSL